MIGITYHTTLNVVFLPVVVLISVGCDSANDVKIQVPQQATSTTLPLPNVQPEPMKIHYLELVVDDVNATCALFAKLHKLTFGEPDASLGNARTAKRSDGSLIGIRAPMHSGERTVTRPYALVDNIETAVSEAKQAGAIIAVPPMKIPGHGTCAILIHNGVESGLWQL